MDGKTPEQEVKIYDEIREALGGVHLSGPMQRVIEVAWPMAYQAGREDAAREAAQLVKVCRYVRNFALPGKHADHVCESEAGHSYPWHKCACGAMYQEVNQQPRTPIRGVGDNTEEQQQGNTP